MSRVETVSTDHATYTYVDGTLQSVDDQPACVTRTGHSWWSLGQLHRDGDQPAIVSDELMAWYQRGSPHRTTGPAWIELGEELTPNTVKFYDYGTQYIPPLIKI